MREFWNLGLGSFAQPAGMLQRSAAGTTRPGERV